MTEADDDLPGAAPVRKRCTVFLSDGDCRCLIVSEHETVWRDGITERNIGELVDALRKVGYHVTLYRVGHPQFFAPEG